VEGSRPLKDESALARLGLQCGGQVGGPPRAGVGGFGGRIVQAAALGGIGLQGGDLVISAGRAGGGGVSVTLLGVDEIVLVG